MKNIHSVTYNDLDWNQLWQNAREKKSWNSKGAADWDKKATSFATRNQQSPYAALLLSRLPLNQEFTVLDFGSGPGTLSLPLAEHVKEITAVDYSQVMLQILNATATDKGIANIKTIHGSWEDDWLKLGIEPHDIAIASRSMNVADISSAIKKLNSHASRYVFITDRIAPSPFDPAAFAAIGRDFNSGPDYIYTINTLYKLNIHPNIEIIELPHEITYKDMKEALESYCWMFKELTSQEKDLLEKYLQTRIVSTSERRLVIQRENPPRWAMIWWEK